MEASSQLYQYRFEHTLDPQQSTTYRDCFMLPKEFGNYKNRYAEDIDNYIYYCIQSHDRKDDNGDCKRGRKLMFEVLYQQSTYINI